NVEVDETGLHPTARDTAGSSEHETSSLATGTGRRACEMGCLRRSRATAGMPNGRSVADSGGSTPVTRTRRLSAALDGVSAAPLTRLRARRYLPARCDGPQAP